MKILIIEDDQSVAELERDYLEINGGFQCDLHTDGTQGLQAALTEDYALVIVDVMLPGLSGFEICRRLREEKDTPVIIISALADDIDKVRGLGLGADDYMTKPFSPSELVARVKGHIQRYQRLVGSREKPRPEILKCPGPGDRPGEPAGVGQRQGGQHDQQGVRPPPLPGRAPGHGLFQGPAL